MTEETFEEFISGFFPKMQKFLIEKNNNYGNSALEPLKLFSKFDHELEGLGHRIDDKLSRIKNAESILDCEDIFYDIIGYSTLVCKKFGWKDPFKYIK